MSIPRKIGGGHKLQTYSEKDGEYDNRNEEYAKLNEKPTEELKKEAQKELPEKKEDVQKVAERDTRIKAIMTNRVYSSIQPQTREKIEGALKKLSDEDFTAFEKFSEDVGAFTQGSGSYSRIGRTITFDQRANGDALDKELGYDFEATTFFHEYGHFVDNMLSVKDSGPSWSMSSDDVSVKDDAIFAFNELMKESGQNVKPLTSFDRISRDQKQAFYAGLAKATGKKNIQEYKSVEKFGYVNAPYKPTWTYEQAVKYFGEESAEHTKQLWKKYEEGMKQYQQAEVDGTNKKAKEAQAKYLKEAEEFNKPIKASLERYGILSDFFGLYTNDRIAPLKNGYVGHRGAYNKQMKATTECFAEYFSFKMTNDTKGLDIMKKYLPKTFDAFEKKFNLIKDY